MNLTCDCHFHTVASGHAYSTLREYMQEAAGRGLELVAMTDHAPNMPGSAHIFHFHNMRVLPTSMYGVELLKGVEANIIDYDGGLDMVDGDLSRLDYVIASFHLPCLKSGTREENTRAMVQAMHNPYVHVLGHPDDSRIQVNYSEIAKAAAATGTLVEVNNSSLSPTSFRQGADENYLRLLECCEKEGVTLMLNSDAHFHADIGNLALSIAMVQKVGYPENRIAGTSAAKFKASLKRR